MRKFTLTLLLFSGLFFGARAQLLFDSLIVYYPFNGNANDSIGTGIDGTVNGATPTTDRFGNASAAYSFDGLDDYIQMANDARFANMNSGFTISAWVVADNTPANEEVIVSKINGSSRQLVWRQQNGGTSHTHFNDGGLKFCTSPPVLQIGQWQHLAIVWDEALETMNHYVDGQLVHSCTTPGDEPDMTNGGWKVGSLTGTGEFWDGKLDELSMWSRALSPAEIQSYYSLSLNYSDIVMDFPMNGSADDISQFDNDATINGATLVDDRHGNPNSAFEFDGIDDYLEVPHDADYKIGLPLTFRAWVWLDSNHVSNPIFTNEDRTNGYSGIAITTNAATQGISASYMSVGSAGSQWRRTFTGSDPISTNEWHQIVVIMRGVANFDVYIDTVLQAGSYSGTGSGLFYDTGVNPPGRIGAYDKSNAASTRYMKGKIDELQLYSRELTLQEIKDGYVPAAPVTGITEDESIEVLGTKVYPNPFNNELNVSLDGYGSASIYDVAGAELLNARIEGQETMDVSSLNSGIYILRVVYSNGKTGAFRIIKR